MLVLDLGGTTALNVCVTTLGSNSEVVTVLFKDGNCTAGRNWLGFRAPWVSPWAGCNGAYLTGSGTVPTHLLVVK